MNVRISPFPKVLIVEDDADLRALYKLRLCATCMPLFADSAAGAREKFAEFADDIVMIALDGHVAGIEPTTDALAAQLRRMFSGTMIAATGDPVRRAALLAAGCNLAVDKEKLPLTILQLLHDLVNRDQQ